MRERERKRDGGREKGRKGRRERYERCVWGGERKRGREKRKGEGGRDRGVRCVYTCVCVLGKGRERVKEGGRERCERCVYVCVCACTHVCGV